MANNVGETFVVNVANNGAVSNLPDDAVLELAARVDRNGAHPFAVGPLPEALLGLQYALVLSQRLAVDAALSGSRADLLRAILAHPLIHSVDAAERCMDELLALQAEWLPQFHVRGRERSRHDYEVLPGRAH
jgi:6-phospho-beta-glucosidase